MEDGGYDMITGDADIKVGGRGVLRDEKQHRGLIVRLVKSPAIQRAAFIAVPHDECPLKASKA